MIRLPSIFIALERPIVDEEQIPVVKVVVLALGTAATATPASCCNPKKIKNTLKNYFSHRNKILQSLKQK